MEEENRLHSLTNQGLSLNRFGNFNGWCRSPLRYTKLLGEGDMDMISVVWNLKTNGSFLFDMTSASAFYKPLNNCVSITGAVSSYVVLSGL